VNKLTVALVGKPNTGKSTLFNRMSRKKLAIVNDFPGVTRDWKVALVDIDGLELELIDTAGWEVSSSGLAPQMREQTEIALQQAAMVILLLDGKTGITNDDLDFIEVLRRTGKELIVAINKSEGKTKLSEADIYGMGMDEPIFISAREGLGILELEEAIKSKVADKPQLLTDAKEEELDSPNIRLAIVGRPNVGKSTIFNKIIGSNRAIVSEIEGTTRDAISHYLTIGDHKFELIDTAGLRRKNKVEEELEMLMVRESINAIRRAHVVALVTTVDNPLEKQDLAIANMAINEGKCLILVVNKMDLIKEKKDFIEDLKASASHELHKLHNLPIIFVQANSGRNLKKIFATAAGLHAKWQEKISTGKFNRWLNAATTANQPPMGKNNRPFKLKYGTQTAIKPPTFKIFTNMDDALPPSYEGYLRNSLTNKFALEGVPLRMEFVRPNNPYAD
jgi:GTP-binding protein